MDYLAAVILDQLGRSLGGPFMLQLKWTIANPLKLLPRIGYDGHFRNT